MEIWKFVLTTQHNQTLLLPKGPILDVQVQNDTIVVWVTNNPVKVNVHFILVNTGEEFDPTGYRFIKTVQLLDGRYVKHVFMRE